SQGGDSPRELAPPGNHLAICIAVVDMGSQSIDFKQGRGPEQKHRVMILWELVHERSQEDGMPMQVHAEFTASLAESSALRPFLVGWRGQAFSPAELASFSLARIVGQPCMLNIVHGQTKAGRTFVKVESASRLPRGMPIPRTEAPLVFFE